MNLRDMVFIPEKDIPPRVGGNKGSKWFDLFKSIPKGQAFVLTLPQVLSSPRLMLRNFKKRGQFKNYYVTQQQQGDLINLYIVNSIKRGE